MGRLNICQFSTAYNTHGYNSNRPIQANNGHLYYFFCQSALGANSNNVIMAKSTDGGINWTQTTLSTAQSSQIATWYDRWSGLSSDYIHVVYTDVDVDDTLYINVNTASSDALSTEVQAFAGASAVLATGAISVTRARGGNVYCATMIDNAAESAFTRLSNADVASPVTFTARDDVFDTIAADANDRIMLVPGWAADNQDIMAFYWDATADEIFRFVHDDSANTWASTSIAATHADVTTLARSWGSTVDLTNSQNLLCAWSATDTASATLSVWKVTESAITETATKVVESSTDDQGYCALCIDTDTDDWYALYCGLVGGSETAFTAVSVNYKKSDDAGATWGSETSLVPTNLLMNLNGLVTIPRMSFTTAVPGLVWASTCTATATTVIIGVEQPVASSGGQRVYGG
jgi:hypothetical protein